MGEPVFEPEKIPVKISSKFKIQSSKKKLLTPNSKL